MKTRAFAKTYGARTVLSLPALEFAPGTICAVIGANGSGKSTLARIIAGVLRADDGRAVREGAERVGYMPQQSYAFRMSTRRNLLLAGGDAQRGAALMEALHLTELSSQRANRLSGGETQRMALARVMMRRWDVLILDEPTAAMDMESTALAERLIARFREECGCTVLLVTHSLPQARRLADEVLYLHGGELAERGESAAVLAAPRDARTRAFLEFGGA